LWAIPGGKVEYGESMRAAAIREVREETGIEVELGGVIWVGDALGPGDPPAWHYTLVDYLGQMIGGVLQAADDAREVAWIPVKNALELPLTPTMPDLIVVLLGEGETDDALG
jgi:ADP-ribose pyrophosphatase YjhB (NUDIX family)